MITHARWLRLLILPSRLIGPTPRLHEQTFFPLKFTSEPTTIPSRPPSTSIHPPVVGRRDFFPSHTRQISITHPSRVAQTPGSTNTPSKPLHNSRNSCPQTPELSATSLGTRISLPPPSPC
ncbi:unnamed protein product [Ectocarpus sp. 12 AP-2014]